MPLDGIAISNICYDIERIALGGRVEKVYQPERDELVLAIRAGGANHRLMLTSSASHPRLHFTKISKPNPATAPLFCMVLRKHISGGWLVCVTQPGFERIVELGITSPNEMGDVTQKRLIIEMMGKHSNIILVDSDGCILEAAKRITHSLSTVRQVLPGMPYSYPPGQGKADPQVLNESAFLQIQKFGQESAKGFIYKNFSGISPATAAEICHRAGISADAPCEALSQHGSSRLYEALSGLMLEVSSKDFQPHMLLKNDTPQDFFCTKATLFAGLEGYESRPYYDISTLLEAYFVKKDTNTRLAQKTADLRRIIQTNIERCIKKRGIHEHTLAQIENRQEYRIKGELLTANIHQLSQGMTTAVLQNYYDESLPIIDIALDPMLTPAENAQRYFKRYNKDKRAHNALAEQISANEDEQRYLEALIETLETCVDEADIDQVREELFENGYAKKRKPQKGLAPKAKPLHYLSSDGADIFVGKNNRQNDELLKSADNRDVWMHVKDIPGSHVIIKHTGGSVSELAIAEAAALAAYYSKGRESSNVPVDYTTRKNVKKPSGAKPGMVIYDNHRTLYITPASPKPSI